MNKNIAGMIRKDMAAYFRPLTYVIKTAFRPTADCGLKHALWVFFCRAAALIIIINVILFSAAALTTAAKVFARLASQ